MRIFVTGATGFIGSVTVQELIRAGHQVVGLARSDSAAQALIAAGALAHHGDLEDLESLRAAASGADGVIHAGFIHDFSRWVEVCQVDRRAIEVLGDALAGTDKPLLVTSGTALVGHGGIATERDPATPSPDAAPRIASEQAASALAEQGLRVSIVRFPPTVHGEGDHGFIPYLIALAREKGVSACIGDGQNRWPAVHRLDAAVIFRLAIEQGAPADRLHGVADTGVPFREIAAAIGRGLDLPVVSIPPEDAAAHFGWIAHFAQIDNPTSSEFTQELLGWRPVHPSLVEDLESGVYFGS